MYWVGPWYGQLAEDFECGNEFSVSVKSWEILDKLQNKVVS